MARIITTELDRANGIELVHSSPPEAQRVDRKIRAVLVSGAGNTGQIGMLTASTRSPNYVDLHKGSNYS